MNKYLSFILAGALMFLLCGISLSQEEAVTEELEYTNGTVVSVDKALTTITISEYDWANDVEVETTYNIDPNVTVENINSWQEIPVGADIDIDYVKDVNNKMVAKKITLYTPETTPETTIEPEITPETETTESAPEPPPAPEAPPKE